MHDACHNSTQPNANAVSAFNAWTAAGFPASKLVLGLPSYGYISKSTATTLQTRSRLFGRNGKGSDSDTSMLQVLNEDGASDGGQIQFRDLIKQGALVKNTMATGPLYTGGAGFDRAWDKCSNTPFLRSTVGQVVTYDDTQSLGLKAAFAKKVGMLGINLFDVHGDTDEWELIDAVRQGLELA
jgi:chitinase